MPRLTYGISCHATYPLTDEFLIKSMKIKST